MHLRTQIAPQEWDEILGIRAALHAKGYRVVPCNEAAKGPMFKGWPSFGYDPDDPEPGYPRTTNADGDPTRAPHFGTGISVVNVAAVDVDIDNQALAQDARQAFEEVAGRTPAVRRRSGSARRMLFYGIAQSVDRITWSDAAPVDPQGNTPKVELDAGHPAQFAYICGLHPSGEKLGFECEPL